MCQFPFHHLKGGFIQVSRMVQCLFVQWARAPWSFFFCLLFNFSISFTFWGVSNFLDLWAVVLLSISVSVHDDLVVRLVDEGGLKCTGLDRCSFRWLTLTFCRSLKLLKPFSSAIPFGLMLNTLIIMSNSIPEACFAAVQFCTPCPLH